MAVWQCGLCSYTYDEDAESTPWDALPAGWVCPICGSPKSAFAPLKQAPVPRPAPTSSEQPTAFEAYQCGLCSHIYDEAGEGVRWADLPDGWTCPVCGSGKGSFTRMARAATVAAAGTAASAVTEDYLGEWRRPADDFEANMADIHRIADSGESVIESMRTRDDLRKTVEYLREKTGGKPIGIKLAAGHLEEDIDIALYAGADFITIDGRAQGVFAADGQR